jgi:hypothetical protein
MMLANEITSHLSVPRALQVGDLAVFVDYKGREIGCKVTRIEAGTVWCQVAGLETWQHCYKIGDVIAVDASKVRRAV